jgi:ABC-type transport system substrate-binding protein
MLKARRTIGTGLVLAGALLGGPATASATTFDGTCTVQGSVLFGSPISPTTQLGQSPFTLVTGQHPATFNPGTKCSGTVNGAAFDGLISVTLSGKGYFGCPGALGSTPANAGTINFDPGMPAPVKPGDPVPRELHFGADFTGPFPLYLLHLKGATGGDGVMAIELLGTGTPDLGVSCLPGGTSRQDFTGTLVSAPGAVAPFSG